MTRTAGTRWSTAAVAGLLVWSASLMAQEQPGMTGNHYPNGVEGIKAGSLPPPGTYLRTYAFRYAADKINDRNGDEALACDVEVMGIAPRLIWISNFTVLGGFYGADILVPFIDTDLSIGPTDDQAFGLGDIHVEPVTLSWHGPRWDAALGLAFWVPTGDYGDPADPGKDYWTTMYSAGGTVYLDAAKSWAASLLARYEQHEKMDAMNVTLGDDFHFEWGIGKSLTPTMNAGLAGYAQWQVADDSGSDVTWDKSVHDQAMAVGPEVGVVLPSIKSMLTLRSLWEFDVEDRTEGNMTVLTFTKPL